MAKESEEKIDTNDTDTSADGDDKSPKKRKKGAGRKSAVKKSPLVKKKKAKLAKPVPKAKGSQTRNIILFVALVGGLALAFALLGNQTGSSGGGSKAAQPKWKVGETVDLTITLVTPDYKDLECAMKDEIAGRHCSYESTGRVFAKKERSARKNPNLLQPYTAVKPKDYRFLAAGMWTSDALKKKLEKENFDRPSPRFNVTCKYKVEGKAKSAKIRWKPNGGWQGADGWFTGSLSDCKIGVGKKK